MMKINLTGVTPHFFLSLDLLFRKQVYFAIQLNAGVVTVPPLSLKLLQEGIKTTYTPLFPPGS